jgi:hypothetical protein
VLTQGIGQRRDLGRVELPARLEGVRVDPVDCDERQLRGFHRSRLVTPLFVPEEGFQAAPEASLIHVR